MSIKDNCNTSLKWGALPPCPKCFSFLLYSRATATHPSSAVMPIAADWYGCLINNNKCSYKYFSLPHIAARSGLMFYRGRDRNLHRLFISWLSFTPCIPLSYWSFGKTFPTLHFHVPLAFWVVQRNSRLRKAALFARQAARQPGPLSGKLPAIIPKHIGIIQLTMSCMIKSSCLRRK